MKIKVYVETNSVGSRCEHTIEVDDDLTEEEILQEAKDAMYEMIEWGFEVLKDAN
jgi:hypothetical protein